MYYKNNITNNSGFRIFLRMYICISIVKREKEHIFAVLSIIHSAFGIQWSIS